MQWRALCAAFLVTDDHDVGIGCDSAHLYQNPCCQAPNAEACVLERVDAVAVPLPLDVLEGVCVPSVDKQRQGCAEDGTNFTRAGRRGVLCVQG